MVEVREVLRGWLEGQGLRVVARRAGVDRKTARRYVEAAQSAGLSRESGVDAVDDELVGVVVEAVRPSRPNGHGESWEALEARHDQIQAWVDGKDGPALSVVKISTLLARSGCVVPYRTVHRYAVARCGFRVKGTSMRVVDGEPGVECQIDFAQMGFLLDPDTGRRRKVHALIAFRAAGSGPALQLRSRGPAGAPGRLSATRIGRRAASSGLVSVRGRTVSPAVP